MLETSLASLVIANITNLIPIKFDSNNYLMWCSTFLPILRGNDLMDIIKGSNPAPPEINLECDKRIVNVIFYKWYEKVQMMLS